MCYSKNVFLIRTVVAVCCSIGIVGTGILTSCSSGDVPLSFDPLEIRISSGVGGITVDTRGAGVISNTLDNNLEVSFIRVDQDVSGYPSDYSGISYLPAVIDKTINRVVFSPTQYYLLDGKSTKFISWYPEATSTDDSETSEVRWDASARTVTFPALDGSTDILLAQPIEGSLSTPFDKINFSHVLTQARVSIKLADAAYAVFWGNITDIEFVGKKQQCVLTLPDASVPGNTVVTSAIAEDATDLKMCGKDDTNVHGTLDLSTATNFTEVGYALFFPHKEADAATAELQIKITTTGGGVHIIPLAYADANMLAGNIYHLKLVFNANTIITTAVISEWNTETTPAEIPVG